MTKRLILLAGALSLAVPFAGYAQASNPEILEQPVVHPDVTTDHLGTFGGKQVRYSALVESTVVPNAKGQPGARLVTYAYVAKLPQAAAKRPVIFFFNGGPIVPSTYLHVGGLGPKRLQFPDDVTKGPEALRLIDNPDSPLDAADLVFIDPASTGYSRVLPGNKPLDYFNVQADAQQVAGFIEAWLDKHGRRESPVYIVGESYGTVRGPVVASLLAKRSHPILIDGLVLFGQATNIIEYSQRPANILSYVLSLPTLSATAWYQGKIDRKGRTLDQVIADAQNFGRDVYLDALFRGNKLPADEKAKVANGLEALTGIPAAYYIAHDLRITKEQFRGELLKSEGKLLGRADARYTGALGPAGTQPDPSGAMLGQVNPFFRRYLRDELKVDWPETYISDPPVPDRFQWDYGGGPTPFSDWPFPNYINELMAANPRFHLFVANGAYDTQTTIGGAAYLFDQQHWAADRAQLKIYAGGHPAYTKDGTAKQFGEDLRAFVQPAR
jgi:hypothetical protein